MELGSKEIKAYKHVFNLISLMKPNEVKDLISSLEKREKPLLFLPDLVLKTWIGSSSSNLNEYIRTLRWDPFKFQYQDFISPENKEVKIYLGKDSWYYPATKQLIFEGLKVEFDIGGYANHFRWGNYLVLFHHNEKPSLILSITNEGIKVIWKIDSDVYPLTLESGKQVLIITEVKTIYALDTHFKEIKITGIRDFDTYLTAGYVKRVRTSPFGDGKTMIFRLLSSEETDGSIKLKLIKVSEFRLASQLRPKTPKEREDKLYCTKLKNVMRPGNIKSLSFPFCPHFPEAFVIITEKGFRLHWRISHSPLFTDLGRVFDFSREIFTNSGKVLEPSKENVSKIALLPSKLNWEQKKEIASQIPFSGLPLELEIEVIEFLECSC